jgi:hypothetical protein
VNRLSVSPETGKTPAGIRAYTGGEAAESKTAAAVITDVKTPPAPGRARSAVFSLEQLIRSLGLPGDRLSAALTGFARAFSLPLEPALLARLRREALTLKARYGGGFAESAALAAAAAAGKGAALSGEALEQYARAIDPDYAAGQDPRKNGEQSSDGAPFGGQDGDERGDPGGEDAARVIREILEKALKRATGIGGQAYSRGDPGGFRPSGGGLGAAPSEAVLEQPHSALSFLNRLPGRDGNFWAVYPFKMNPAGLEIRVSVWVLLNGFYSGNGSAGSSVRGITVNAAGKKRRWVFSIKNLCGSGAKTRILVSSPCEEAERKKMEGEIRNILGDFGGKVTLEDGGEADGFFTRAFLLTSNGGFSPVEEDA